MYTNRSKRGLCAFLVAFVLTVSSLASASANQGVQTPAVATGVDYELARKAAVVHVANAAKLSNSAWAAEKVQLLKGVELYDPEGAVTAYLFSVAVNGGPAGYIVVGTEADEFPILEFSFQGAPFSDQAIRSARGQVLRPATSDRITYLGPVSFALSVGHSDGSSSMVDLRDGTVLNRKPNRPGTTRPRPTHPEQARGYWHQVSKSEIGSDNDGVTDVWPGDWETGTMDHGEVAGVPAWDQWIYHTDSQGRGYWTGCSPTAAADIMEFWMNNGYPNMAVITNNQVVFDLRSAMGTTNSYSSSCNCYPGSTFTSSISPGMQKYARGRGFSTATSSFYSSPSYANFVTEVKNGRPALIGVDNHTYYKYHSLTSIGYVRFSYNGSSTGHEYLVAHDNHSDTANTVYLAYGRNYSAIQLHTFKPEQDY